MPPPRKKELILPGILLTGFIAFFASGAHEFFSWQILDQHHNDSSFRDLALQPAPDGSDFGYQRETAPPVKIDRNTGNATPALHPELAFTWVPSPLGQLPHHTLSFQVKPQDRSFRYLRLRQLTHAQHTSIRHTGFLLY